MAQKDLDNFRGYQRALELFDLVVDDLNGLQEIPMCWRLISQQVASADSVAANIEEGFGRESEKEYRHFLIISRGSARETRGRYLRMKHWLESPVITERVNRCDEIIGILTKVINQMSHRLRGDN